MGSNDPSYSEIFCNADAVAFDFDSTLVRDEFIDQMADYVGKGQEVSRVTQLAMSGTLAFEDALEARLKVIDITKDTFEEFIASEPHRITPGAEELVAELTGRGILVYIISGSFVQAIVPVANKLSIPLEHIHANMLIFDEKGCFTGFDRDRPTARKGGKRRIVEQLKAQHKLRRLVFIGDGATDLETYDPKSPAASADLFIGFGGNVVRDIVRRAAPVFVNSFFELRKWLIDSANGNVPASTSRVSCCASATVTPQPAVTFDGAMAAE